MLAEVERGVRIVVLYIFVINDATRASLPLNPLRSFLQGLILCVR